MAELLEFMPRQARIDALGAWHYHIIIRESTGGCFFRMTGAGRTFSGDLRRTVRPSKCGARMCRSTGFRCIRRFQLRGKCPSDHGSRFRKPPVSSRTVGFPESGWRPWPVLSPSRPSQSPSKLKRRLTYAPQVIWFACWLDICIEHRFPGLNVLGSSPL